MVNTFNKLRYYPYLDLVWGTFLAIAVISVPLLFASYYFAFETDSQGGVLVGIWLFILGVFPTLKAVKQTKKEIDNKEPKDKVDNLWFFLSAAGFLSLFIYAEFGYKGHVIYEMSIEMMLFIMKRMIGLE